jgi:hypothetical protein
LPGSRYTKKEKTKVEILELKKNDFFKNELKIKG